MKNKKSKSKNILTCSISGIERMSNKEYLANKASKKGIDVEEFKACYINKEQYSLLKSEVEAGGLDKPSQIYSVDRELIKIWLKYNGRGRYVQPKTTHITETVQAEEAVPVESV